MKRRQIIYLGSLLVLAVMLTQTEMLINIGSTAQPQVTAAAAWEKPGTMTKVSAQPAFGKMPLYFIENRGQVDGRVDYYLQGRDKTLYFTNEGITFTLTGPGISPAVAGPSVPKTARHRAAWPTAADEPVARQRWTLKLDFVGANPKVKPRGEQPTAAAISYFKGSQSEWRTGLATYTRVVYPDLWPGIDLVFSGTVNHLKHEFVVKPGADPTQIKLAYRGASAVEINEAGQLAVSTPAGGFSDDQPYSYQDTHGGRREIATSYALAAKSAAGREVYGFRVGEYDRTEPLVIDPVMLVYCGFIGGSGDDRGNSIAVDSAGNAYITGSTTSTEATFPVTTGPDLTFFTNNCTDDFGNPVPCSDAFVAKVNAAGTALIYCGYIGGAQGEGGFGIAVDSLGNAYVAGTTTSSETTFPVLVGPGLTYHGGQDAFVAKVNAAGTGLLYCGYLGGAKLELVSGIALDSAGNAYLTGTTQSDESTFPVLVGPDLTFNGGGGFFGTPIDAFVAKVKADGSGLSYCGYIGGAGDERGFGIAVDSAGNAYVTGQTNSDQTTFPVVGGPDLTYNGGFFIGDAFVAKVNPSGSALLYCGYIGGGGDEQGNSIAVDGAGNAYVTGWTTSSQTSFPVAVGPDLTFNGGSYHGDAFVAKVNASGTGLVYCGYIGGAGGDDAGNGIAVDSAGNAYVVGLTDSDQTTFPVTGGPGLIFPGSQFIFSFSDVAFIAKVNAAGTALAYCGYIGGDQGDSGKGVAVDGAGNAYVIGQTRSTQATFPVTVGPDLTYNGGIDAFVAKVEDTSACLFAVNPQSFSLSGGGSTRSVNVLAPSGCTWAADSNATWIMLPPGSGGSGNGAVSFTVTTNTGAARSGTLTIAGRTVTVTQGGPTAVCTYSLSPAAAIVLAHGGAGNVLVQTLEACPWTVTSSAAWLSLTSSLHGTGLGAVSYSVAPNPTSAARSATLSFDDRNFTVRQAANFSDVPQSHSFYSFIGQLSARGITSGCGGGNYCPDNPVTRGQMAVFIIKALGEFNPTPPPSPRFGDVPTTDSFYPFIEALAARRITSGCGGGNYCPDNPVTRGQMAVFIIKALGEFNPPSPPTPRFGDVPTTHPFYPFIEKMAALGITAGCGGGNYCPDNPVTRGQMAVFLVKAFGL